MGDDIGWMQPSIYHRGLMVGETPNIDRIGRKAACSCTTTPSRAAPPAARPSSPECIRTARAWSCRSCRAPFPICARHAGARQVPARSRLHHRRVRQEPSGRPSRFAADGARLPGVLGLPLSPGCDAAGELPGHQQDPTEQAVVPPCTTITIPGIPNPPAVLTRKPAPA